MSHITRIKAEIKDLDSLASACRELGVELRLDQKTFKTYAGQRRPCAAAVVLPGRDAYEVGVVDNGDGSYRLHCDNFAGGDGMVEKVGRDCKTLVQHYGAEKTVRKAKALGWQVKRERLKDGSLRFRCKPKQQQQQAKRW